MRHTPRLEVVAPDIILNRWGAVSWAARRSISSSVPIAAERRIKGWSRAKKEAYMRGDFASLVALAKRGSKEACEPGYPTGDAPWNVLRGSYFARAPQDEVVGWVGWRRLLEARSTLREQSIILRYEIGAHSRCRC
jgi:hypothetical protein